MGHQQCDHLEIKRKQAFFHKSKSRGRQLMFPQFAFVARTRTTHCFMRQNALLSGHCSAPGRSSTSSLVASWLSFSENALALTKSPMDTFPNISGSTVLLCAKTHKQSRHQLTQQPLSAHCRTVKTRRIIGGVIVVDRFSKWIHGSTAPVRLSVGTSSVPWR